MVRDATHGAHDAHDAHDAHHACRWAYPPSGACVGSAQPPMLTKCLGTSLIGISIPIVTDLE